MSVTFRLNGSDRTVDCAPDTPLVKILREDLALTATKEGCSIGRCGACMVMIDGTAVNSCLVMAFQLEGREVITTEGISTHPLAALVRDALIAENAFQCGYCAPGFVMALADLFGSNPDASETQIRTAMEGNICRCTGYHSILRGAREAARRLKEITT